MIKKNKIEMVYIGIMFIITGMIYLSFNATLVDVVVSDVGEKSKAFLVSLNSYVNLSVGVLLISFLGYMFTHMRQYKIGKIFALYLMFITISICISIISGSVEIYGELISKIFSFISNVILFWTIGYLTHIVKGKTFKRSVCILTLFTIMAILLYVTLAFGDYGYFMIQKENIVICHYFVSLVVMIINLILTYSQSTIYSKRQSKALIFGLIIGIMLFIVVKIMPMFAIVKVTNSEEVVEISYRQNINSGAYENYSVLMFTGIIIVIIYMLIKREYLIISDSYNLFRYILSGIYILASNTFVLLVMQAEIQEYMIFNSIILVPLLVYDRLLGRTEIGYGNNLIEVLEDERQRLSIQLHDGVLQDVIAIVHKTQDEEIREKLKGVIGELRAVSQDLYPTIVEDLRLEQALNVFVEELRGDYNMYFEYTYQYPKGILPKGESIILYRVVKEIVVNAIKHSKGKHVMIDVYEEDSDIVARVKDDGVGFHIPDNIGLLKTPHMGLYTVKRQVAELGGQIYMVSDENGTEFIIKIPVE